VVGMPKGLGKGFFAKFKTTKRGKKGLTKW
jgi:hypothetical protein